MFVMCVRLCICVYVAKRSADCKERGKNTQTFNGPARCLRRHWTSGHRLVPEGAVTAVHPAGLVPAVGRPLPPPLLLSARDDLDSWQQVPAAVGGVDGIEGDPSELLCAGARRPRRPRPFSAG